VSIKLKFAILKAQFQGQSLVQNFRQLLFNNGLNLLVPAISLTYVFRVIGAEKFAFISFSTALIGLLSFVVEFGFITSMVRTVAIHKNDTKKLSEIASSTISVKLLICLITILLLLVYLFFDNTLKDFNLVIIFSIGQLVGQALNLNYFFLGLQETKMLTQINLLSRILILVFLVLLIKNENDFILWPLIYSFTSIITSIAFAVILFKKYLLFWVRPSMELILDSIKEGFYIFSANLAGSVLVYGPTLLLGFISTRSVLGYFGLAERISNIISIIFLSVSQAILPNLSVFIANKEAHLFKKYFWNIIKYSTMILLIGFLIFYSLIDYILLNFAGIIYANISFVLKSVGFYTIFVCLNTIVFPFLVSLKLDKSLSLIYLGMAVFFLCTMTIINYSGLDYTYLIYAIMLSHLSILILNMKILKKELDIL
jgi:PST family polysaccharide transporter